MNIGYHIRNWLANLLGYRQGIVFRDGIPIGVREGFRIKRRGIIIGKFKR